MRGAESERAVRGPRRYLHGGDQARRRERNDSVPGEQGYYRAPAGFDRAFLGGLEPRELLANLSGSTRKTLASPDMRRQIGVKRESSEVSQKKRARRILG